MTKQQRSAPQLGQTLYVSTSHLMSLRGGFSAEVTHVGTEHFMLTYQNNELQFSISDWRESSDYCLYVAYASEQEFDDLQEAARLYAGLRKWFIRSGSFISLLPHLDTLRRAHDALVGASEKQESTKRRVEYKSEVVDVTNEDDMCPNCVTPWKCNGPHIPQEDN